MSDLSPNEVEQLQALHSHSVTWPGDLISKPAEKSLRDKGLVARLGGWCVVTVEGEQWLDARLEEDVDGE